MRRNTLGAIAALGLALTLALNPAGALAVHPGQDTDTDTDADASGAHVRVPLLTAQAVTKPYHDVAEAEADGYVRTSDCSPGKGIHYLRSVAEGQEELDPTRPNALVYAPRPDGSLKLLGVEYVSHTPATLFGHAFLQSTFVFYYTLHIWLWDHRPDDLFAADNPHITCEH
jgi:hypothetical protein